MKRHLARETLERFLAGNDLEEPDLRALMALETEAQWFDLKDGAEANDRRKARHVVRSYTSGFANADGGLLIIGVSDGEGKAAGRKITPTMRPGGAPLDAWARSCLEDMAGFLVPPPRFQVLPVDGTEVLIVGTARAPVLVPCVENGTIAHWLRIGDSTLNVPPYLMSDLLLGRRAHPVLDVRRSGKGGGVNGAQGSWTLTFAFEVENQGFIPAIDVRIGLIAWGMRPQDRRGSVASEHLRTFIELADCPSNIEGILMAPVHLASTTISEPSNDVAPFEVKRFGGSDLVIPQASGRPMRSAMYVLASGHPPAWYQLDWIVPSQHGGAIEMDLIRVGPERPEVAYDSEWRAPPNR